LPPAAIRGVLHHTLFFNKKDRQHLTALPIFFGGEGALHFMYTICYFFMQLFLQDFAVGSEAAHRFLVMLIFWKTEF
jgi:hypothetical protein